MKKVSKGIEPPLLENYRTEKPINTWEQFKRSKSRREETQNQLIADQGGLCAYCEIDLLQGSGSDEPDFRVEHFHPKSDETTSHNWHLDWRNLLGCCHGGSQRNVTDAANRFTSHESSCDVPKGNKNLDAVILNPLDVPAFPRLFSCSRSNGRLSLELENCNAANVSAVKAQNTIDELNLDAVRLRRLRKVVLDQLNDQMQTLVAAGLSIGDARTRLARMNLEKNPLGHWPKFFTSIRGYLGNEAEMQLRNIHYSG
jgi:uncharacterized protein (TIGR02646 family)